MPSSPKSKPFDPRTILETTARESQRSGGATLTIAQGEVFEGIDKVTMKVLYKPTMLVIVSSFDGDMLDNHRLHLW